MYVSKGEELTFPNRKGSDEEKQPPVFSSLRTHWLPFEVLSSRHSEGQGAWKSAKLTEMVDMLQLEPEQQTQRSGERAL